MCSVFCSQHGPFTCFHSILLGDDWSSKYLAPIRQRQWLKVSLQFGVWALRMNQCTGELRPWRLSVPKNFCPFCPAVPYSVFKGLNQAPHFCLRAEYFGKWWLLIYLKDDVTAGKSLAVPQRSLPRCIILHFTNPTSGSVLFFCSSV